MKGFIKVGKCILLISLLILTYFVYDAIYPGVNFYKNEYFKVTGRIIPKSAEFIEKSASYPDFHGDYCSSSQIKLSKEDYQSLFDELSLDGEMEKTSDVVGFKEFGATLDEKDRNKIVKKFVRKGEEITEWYLFIGFYDDLESI
ncbi:MAG: hypothetical protein EOO13_17750 [Chitinophagaceae bacterium]|nr:MAG: hypothetical protein EOO13_17750 [Chitinophagaceae bacterium]